MNEIKSKIKKAINETLVIQNRESLDLAVERIYSVLGCDPCRIPQYDGNVHGVSKCVKCKTVL